MNDFTKTNLKRLLVVGMVVCLTPILIELLFLLPGITAPFGTPVSSCSLAEGSAKGWPFLVFVPGCSPADSNNTALAVDIAVAFALACGVVFGIMRKPVSRKPHGEK
jgi:hypothetical protein